jgi:hypothetical protein
VSRVIPRYFAVLAHGITEKYAAGNCDEACTEWNYNKDEGNWFAEYFRYKELTSVSGHKGLAE